MSLYFKAALVLKCNCSPNAFNFSPKVTFINAIDRKRINHYARINPATKILVNTPKNHSSISPQSMFPLTNCASQR